MVTITNKTEHDPVAALRLTDAYMRWALEAAEEVVGKTGLNAALHDAGLDRFIDNYPADITDATGAATFGDYAALSAQMLTFFGRAGKGMVLRVGRLTAQKAIEHQSGIFSLGAVLAAKVMAPSTQIKMGLAAMLNGFQQLGKQAGQEFIGSITDGGDYWILTYETCPVCAGKHADTPICWLMEGAIEESGRQIFGKFFDVVQTECRAMGAPACVWHVPKTPTEE